MPEIRTTTFGPAPGTFGPGPGLRLRSGQSIAVIGAGAFGGWAALFLRRKGLKVTLVDAWGAGNARSSSGDETRVIRSTYGANGFYFDLNVRALELWKEHERSRGQKVFFNTGVLWFCYEERAPLVDDSIPFARKHGMEYEYLSCGEVAKRYPAVRTDDLHHGWYDPHGGYLKARDSVQEVQKAFVEAGGTFVQAQAAPGALSAGQLENLVLSDGSQLRADAYLFACGAWLGRLFPELLADVITCSRQEVYYFGVPAEDARSYDNLPVWVDLGRKDFYYGIPGNASRGFKLGVDKRGKAFDPTSDDRLVDPRVLADARTFIEHRFPGLKNAPLVENRVCPYENSPDGNFIFRSHPEAENLFFLGGGSGHGFKHGPALGELVAAKLTDNHE